MQELGLHHMVLTCDCRDGARHDGKHVLVELDREAAQRLLRLVGNDEIVHSLSVAAHEVALDLHAFALLRSANNRKVGGLRGRGRSGGAKAAHEIIKQRSRGCWRVMYGG